ncbi:hypothetical protein [Endozoicomonas sp. SESOKO1]|uniref:hypothetical protein n=1 Tax=Endozoicomonas sp. SESOKO1 TaxID=2828742 RepID=UPI0021482B55|nr:hypothetical protein [Endozoicomonas sp. SESOKO1]
MISVLLSVCHLAAGQIAGITEQDWRPPGFTRSMGMGTINAVPVRSELRTDSYLFCISA